MLVLALDTTSAHGSMALLDGPGLRAVTGFRTAQPRHAESLLLSVEHLLSHVEAKLHDVEGFAVALGPGSFTGLRIGIAAVEGLSYALDRPAVGVSTLEATAFHYRHRRGLIVALIEAYRGEVYGASYTSDGTSLSAASEATCMPPAEFLDTLPDTPELVAGSGVAPHRNVLEQRLARGVTLTEPSLFLGESVARIGARRLDSGERAPLGGLDAFYVRSSEAERNLDKRSAQSS